MLASLKSPRSLAVTLFAIAQGAVSPVLADDLSLSPGQALAARAGAMSEPERVRSLSALPLGERGAFFRSLGVADIVAFGRQSLEGLGVYHARVTREERVHGHLCGPDVVEVTVREKPHAVLLEFVAGAHKGRRALYNVELRPYQMLARESGILGLFAMWLSIDSSIVRRYTNHTIAEVGFGAMLDVMQADQAKAATVGGYHRSDEGIDGRGFYCMFFSAPKGANDLYATRLRYCVDSTLELPMKIEVFDDKGRREYVEYQDLQRRLTVKKDFFTPRGAGL